MSSNELPLEKRIAAELDVDCSNPPVIPETVLNKPDLVPVHGQPSSTKLGLEGFDAREITTDFLVEIHDLADDHDVPLHGISVRQRDLVGQ